MAKKTPTYSLFDESEKLRPIFEGFFKASFEEEIKKLRIDIDKQDSKSFQIMLGAVIVCLLFIGGLVWDSHTFREQYNGYFLQTQQQMTEQINSLKKENSEMKDVLSKEIDNTTEKQEFLEKILLQKR